jgi:hypothetical protein
MIIIITIRALAAADGKFLSKSEEVHAICELQMSRQASVKSCCFETFFLLH